MTRSAAHAEPNTSPPGWPALNHTRASRVGRRGDAMPQVSGEVEFAALPHAVHSGELRIRLVDVSRADAAATTVAEQVITDVIVQSVGSRFSFVLDVPDLDPRLTYAVEAHLDADGSGQVSVGDFRTMEHVGVTAGTVGEPVTVRLRPVT